MKNIFNAKRWLFLWSNMDSILNGLKITLLVAILGLCLALLLGVVLGLFSTSKNNAVKGFARVYVEIFQNTPLVIQAFFYYNGLAYLGIILSEFHIGIIAVGLYHGAYISEVVRTGIMAVPKGQKEAAQSQGFTYLQSMIYIVLPQTLKMIMPPLANQALALFKNTSVLAMIAGGDLMYHADSFATLYDYHAQGYITAGLLYFIICFPLAKLAAYLEQRANQVPGTRKKKAVEGGAA